MRRWAPLVYACTILFALAGRQACQTGPRDFAPGPPRKWTHIPGSQVVEISVSPDTAVNNGSTEVNLKAVFTSPSGEQKTRKGFFARANVWQLRMSPDEPGDWTYVYELTGRNGETVGHGSGSFISRPQPHPGSDRAFAKGIPYFPIGLQDCINVQGADLLPIAIDGKLRTDAETPVSVDEYLRIYAAAGFNLFRFSQKNCSYDLYDDLDHYRQNEIEATDKLLRLAHNHGFHLMFGFFGNHTGYHSDWENGGIPGPDVSDKERRFIDYCIARWGAFVDIWELLNERNPPDSWTRQMAAYVHSDDPDDKPVSTSWERPYLPDIDIDSPHWYESENELNSDLRVHQQAASWEQTGKTVIVGEQGNSGMNWDARSATRMRIRLWTTLFEGIGLVFWNTSWSMFGVNNGVYVPGSAANIYLGPEERAYTRVLRDFADQLPLGMAPGTISLSAPDEVRGYAMHSRSAAAVYLQHSATHASPMHGLSLRLNFPAPAGPGITIRWIDPVTGAVTPVADATGPLAVPDFTVDLALLVSAVRAKQ